ncbi:MAG: hypothetical protein JWN45_733 [Acidobacteriaceae bacterium]|nr:hypothetical protein [Acidobacteriaceae bacterium]
MNRETMIRIVKKLTFICIVVFLSPACYALEKEVIPPGLSSALAILRSGAVRRIELYYTPEDILTRSATSSERLISGSQYKVILQYPSQQFLNKVVDALRSERFATTVEDSVDVRLGVLMFTESDKTAVSLYFDQLGRKCTFGGVPYAAGGPLRALFRDRLVQLPR